MDPTGAFDIEDFVSSVTEIFASREKKFSEYSEYKDGKLISSKEASYYMNNSEMLGNDKAILQKKTKTETMYALVTKTEFGMLSKQEKVNSVSLRIEKLIDEYQQLQSDLKEDFKNLGIGLGDGLFNIASTPSFEDFATNYLLNNLESVGDLGQHNVDAINLLLDYKYLSDKLDCLKGISYER